MTPTQLRSYAAVVRHGSVRAAAVELGVTEAAVSGNVGALRKALDDRLFHASGHGLVFTPGGLRLATRAVELLGLQEQTRREVGEANGGTRRLRIAATSLFAEYAAPGLIELFSTRADDLEVELIVEPSTRFGESLLSHSADVAIGPAGGMVLPGLVVSEFLRYELIAVSAPGVATAALDDADWLLGPSAVEPSGVSQFILQRVQVPEERQRIYPSHAAAVEEARNGRGIAIVPAFAVNEALRSDRLRRIAGSSFQAAGVWTIQSQSTERLTQAARELVRFVSTPRAIQAMLSGSGSNVARFKPRVHITLWS